jgi:hypothetical protein
MRQRQQFTHYAVAKSGAGTGPGTRSGACTGSGTGASASPRTNARTAASTCGAGDLHDFADTGPVTAGSHRHGDAHNSSAERRHHD